MGVLGATDGEQPQPSTMLDHALNWAARVFYVFPAEPHLGRPYIADWRGGATTSRDTILGCWSKPDWYNADIGSAPDRSGHFVLSAHHDEGGIESLADLEGEYGELKAELDYHDRWGSRFLWFKGCAYTSHHKLGRGLHVLGAGHAVFLPAEPHTAPKL